MINRSRTPIVLYGIGLLAFALSIRAGLALPDADQGFLSGIPGIAHRSLLTHGALLPILLFLVARRYLQPVIRMGSIGFCAAFAVHLSYDLFPAGYNGRWCWGYGCIYVPILGRASALFSFLWIGGGVVVSLYIALLLVRNLLDVVLALCGLAVSYGHMVSVEPDIALKAFLALVIISGFVLVLPSDVPRMMRNLYARVRAGI